MLVLMRYETAFEIRSDTIWTFASGGKHLSFSQRLRSLARCVSSGIPPDRGERQEDSDQTEVSSRSAMDELLSLLLCVALTLGRQRYSESFMSSLEDTLMRDTGRTSLGLY